MAVLLKIDTTENTIEGDVNALDLLTVENVATFDTPNGFSEYEQNIEALFEVTLHTGDTIEVEGYNGIYELLIFHKLKEEFQAETVASFASWARDMLTQVNEAKE